MSEKTRIEIWERIREAQLLGSDEVIIDIKTTNLLLECARLINEAAASELWAKGNSYARQMKYVLEDDVLRTRCEELSMKL